MFNYEDVYNIYCGRQDIVSASCHWQSSVAPTIGYKMSKNVKTQMPFMHLSYGDLSRFMFLLILALLTDFDLTVA